MCDLINSMVPFAALDFLGALVSFGPICDKSYVSLEIDINFLSLNCAIWDIQKASIGSVIKSTSMSLDLKPSKCGLESACLRLSAVK